MHLIKMAVGVVWGAQPKSGGQHKVKITKVQYDGDLKK